MSRPGKHKLGASKKFPSPYPSVKGTSKSSTSSSNPYQDLSYLFRIDSLEPNFNVQEARCDQFRRWIPPDRLDAYNCHSGTLNRWKAGRIQPVTQGDIAFDAELHCYSPSHFRSTTIFTQSPWTDNFLAVPFDAQKKDVCQEGGWQDLGFREHFRSDGSVYSYIDLTAERWHLAAPGTAPWMNDLFTDRYRYQSPNGAIPPPTMCGLTGKLSILLALVAFACKESDLDQVLQQSVRLGQWSGLPHGVNPHEGRTWHPPELH